MACHCHYHYGCRCRCHQQADAAIQLLGGLDNTSDPRGVLEGVGAGFGGWIVLMPGVREGEYAF